MAHKVSNRTAEKKHKDCKQGQYKDSFHKRLNRVLNSVDEISELLAGNVGSNAIMFFPFVNPLLGKAGNREGPQAHPE